tara:strand:- start:5047 stop:6105 length:1059 start_codon:yes stop_codon:yes gene_type:complete
MKLTEEQKQFIDKNYIQIPDVDKLTKVIFKDESLDGRNKEGKAVAEYMLQKGYGYKTRAHKKAKKITLTEEQKELITEYSKDQLNSLQIAQLIFQDKEVKNLSSEQRCVAEYLKTNSANFIKLSPEEETESYTYCPPKTETKVIKKINEFTQAELNEDINKLKREERENVLSLKNNLSSPRFSQLMETYKCNDRELFEAEFVRAIWDKPDLTSDEVNLYINVCIDYINLKTIQSNMEKLNRMFEDCEDQTEMSVKLAEILKAKSSEYHQCEQRQESLIKKLNGDRSVRLKDKKEKFASVLTLVQSFQEEEERSRMIKIAEMQKKLVSEEATKLENMDSWKARILGLRKEDVL